MADPRRRVSARSLHKAAAQTVHTTPEPISPARRAAFQVLMALAGGTAHSDDLLHAAGRGAALAGLAEADRNLTTALVLGVLRWQIALDRRLSSLFTRPGSVVTEEVMIALRLGAFQLLHMDRIPAHAALSESVALVRSAGQEYATGMVNAVLRKIAGGPRTEPRAIYETTAAAGERLGHPSWITERWEKTYGRRTALAICEANQREPEIAGVLSVEQNFPSLDEGSRLIAEIAAAVAPKSKSMRTWDCCAAPAGKTAILAMRLRAVGGAGELLATDLSARRAHAMEERLGSLAMSAGLGGKVRCLVSDAAALPATEGAFDLILCDVPCSGTGTLGRNPELRQRLKEADFTRQAHRQRQILRAAMGRAAAGGRLVYSTCSLEPEECEEVVASALSDADGEWGRVAVGGVLQELGERGILRRDMASAVHEGALRTIPGVHAMDGFYAAVLERVTGP